MRRILYVDGFNFFYGVAKYWSDKTEKKLAGLCWCDFRALVERRFPAEGSLEVKYFTAPVSPNVELEGHREGETKRYHLWMRAVRAISGLTVVRGFYKPCGDKGAKGRAKRREEKQTDVNLAVEMMMDAFQPEEHRPEHVYLLSGDYDLMPVVFALQERLAPPIPVTVLLPSAQRAPSWSNAYEETRKRLQRSHPVGSRPAVSADPVTVEVLKEAILANSLLGYTLHDPKGEFECPAYWRLTPDYLAKHCKTEWRPDLDKERSVGPPLPPLGG
jgi:hypothetical protein